MSYDSLLVNTSDIIQESVDKWNRKSESIIAADEPCRFEFGHVIARGPAGEDIVCSATVFYRKGTTINLSCKVRYSGRIYKVVDVQRPQDSSGEHHVEVLVK